MFRQYDDGLAAEQALFACLLQVAGELQVQSLDALIIGGKQFGLDPQQITPLGRHARNRIDLDAQVGKVVPRGALCRPERVGTQRCQA